ncbi:MAG: ABC transporter ATP-binding protein, partial [Oscillospiraceae bacterium]
MLKIMSYLKKSILPIVIILALLIGQAICDLSLPDFNSKIINVGIQQGGVQNATPTKIRKAEMEKLVLFMTKQDGQTILNRYDLSNDLYQLKGDYNHKKEL